MKKGFVLVMMIAMLFVNSSTCNAQSKEMFFNLKSGESKTGFDATKSSSNFENKFYVRHYDCDPPSASFRTQKYNAIYGGNSVSNTISMLATTTTRKSNTYLSGKAVGGRVYKLRCAASSTIHTNEVIGVSGIWTP